jgi:hypothetical protein
MFTVGGICHSISFASNGRLVFLRALSEQSDQPLLVVGEIARKNQCLYKASDLHTGPECSSYARAQFILFT